MASEPAPAPLGPSELVDTMLALDPLGDLPRTGWLLRGVSAPESIAAHSYGVALAAMFLVDALRAEGVVVDGEKVLRMALLHDAAEVHTGDIPKPHKAQAAREAIRQMEEAVLAELLPRHLPLLREAEARTTLEARVVKAADRIQLLVKLLAYSHQRRGDLREFWASAPSLPDEGLGVARAVMDEILARGRPFRPVGEE